MSVTSDEDCTLTPKELKQQEINAELSFLPEKSREKYLLAYEGFNKWRLAKGANTFSETVLLSYFIEMSQTKQSSTMWSVYSMLKATIKTKHDVQIETYPKLISFLKRRSVGHKSKKSKVFKALNIETFLNEAPDCSFLAAKVILMIGISGACRNIELLNLIVSDVEKLSEKVLLIKLKNTKTNLDRTFVKREEYVKFVERYQILRPANIKTDRFFIQYYNNKCTKQPIGINKISATPRRIATFLKLAEPQLYTGHCFRRTSATLLADSGADLTTLKRHGGWKTNTVAEGYIEDSIENKSKICKRITDTINLKKTSKSSNPWSNSRLYTSKDTESVPSTSKDTESVQYTFESRSESPTFTVFASQPSALLQQNNVENRHSSSSDN